MIARLLACSAVLAAWIVGLPVLAQDIDTSWSSRLSLGYVNRSDAAGVQTSGSRASDTAFLEGRIRFAAVGERWEVRSLVRGFGSSQRFEVNNLDINVDVESRGFLELRELFVRRSDIAGISGLYLSLGRHRYRDTLSHWWDADVEGVTLGLDRSLVNGFVAVARRSAAFRTDGSDRPRGDLADISRLFGRVRWQYHPRHFLETRWHLQSDDGSQIVRDENFSGLTFGTRLRGELYGTFYSAEAIAQRGDSELTVGGVARSVSGWAGLLDVEKSFESTGLRVGARWHRTSPGGPGSENGFRPTKLDSMAWYTSATPVVFHKYGDASRFSLSNIQLLGVYLTGQRGGYSGLLSATRLRRIDADDRVVSREIFAPLAAGEADLGSNLDLVVSRLWRTRRFGLRQAEARLRLGNFFPGDALPTLDSRLTRLQFEWLVRL